MIHYWLRTKTTYSLVITNQEPNIHVRIKEEIFFCACDLIYRWYTCWRLVNGTGRRERQYGVRWRCRRPWERDRRLAWWGDVLVNSNYCRHPHHHKPQTCTSHPFFFLCPMISLRKVRWWIENGEDSRWIVRWEGSVFNEFLIGSMLFKMVFVGLVYANLVY